MPMGLTNAPSAFQNDMELTLAGLVWYCCMVYLDDVIIYSETFKDHLQHTREVLSRFQEAKVLLKTKKCHFCCEEVKYLGHIVGRGAIRPNPEKVKVIKECQVPRNVAEIHQFMGIVGYYR